MKTVDQARNAKLYLDGKPMYHSSTYHFYTGTPMLSENNMMRIQYSQLQKLEIT
jgi:hypothetical protein